MHEEDLLKIFQVIHGASPFTATLPNRNTALSLLRSQALDPQDTGVIPAAEFLKSLAIFGGENAFTPDEATPTPAKLNCYTATVLSTPAKLSRDATSLPKNYHCGGYEMSRHHRHRRQKIRADSL